MARVSFGSRAGSASDYLVGNGEFQYRQSTLNGVYISLQELTDALKAETEACTQSQLPDLTTCELSIRDDAVLPLLRPAIGPYSDGGEHDLPAVFKTAWTTGNEGYPGLDMTLPMAQVASILAAEEGQPRQIVQRAASRAIVQSVEATDGFKYSFNNAWAAKDDGGLRFSYICQDSMQNKDRHANGFTKTQKHLKGEGERGPRKPTYDCKGSISVKFSAVRKSVDIYYRHYAIHASVAERRPQPRAASRPRKERVSNGRDDIGQVPLRQEEDTGGLLGTLQAEKSAFVDPGIVRPQARAEMPNTGRPLKRKRDSGMGPPPPRKDPNKPLSLVDLLKQSEDARSPPPAVAVSKPKATSYVPPPVEYSLPSWQAPPPPPPAPPQRKQQQPSRHQPTWSGPSYAPPYQPQQYPQPPTYPQSYGPSAPVAIPRTPAQPVPNQEHQGLPGRQPHPQAQGLFSTLKPVRKEEYTAYEPHFVVYQSARAKTSCHHCRVSKKKCDEGRPMCGACARTGKLDCTYEEASNKAPEDWQAKFKPSPQGSTQNSSQTPVQPAGQATPGQQTPAHFGMQQTPSQFGAQQTNASAASGASSQTLQAGSQSQPNLHSHSQLSQQTQQMERGGSPDPWFPRR